MAGEVTRTESGVVAKLVEAAADLKADLLSRAEWDDDAKIVCAGAGAWFRFCEALAHFRTHSTAKAGLGEVGK